MSSSTVTVEAIVPDEEKFQIICAYLDEHDEKMFHVESSLRHHPKLLATVQYAPGAVEIEDLVDLISTNSELSSFDVFNDQVGEQIFSPYSNGKLLKTKQKAFEKRLHNRLDTIRPSVATGELNPNHQRLIGTWSCSGGGTINTWKFSENRFIATLGTSKEPEKYHRVEGDFEIGSEAILMEPYEEGLPPTKCVPLTLIIEDNDCNIAAGPLFVSCLFPRSKQKLWLEFGSLELLEDIPEPYGKSSDKPVGTYERDDEGMFRLI